MVPTVVIISLLSGVSVWTLIEEARAYQLRLDAEEFMARMVEALVSIERDA